MSRFLKTLLCLGLLVTAGCRGSGAECHYDIDCAGPQMCHQGKCVYLYTLTLVGKVANSAIAGATVEVEIGGQVFSTVSNASGDYTLQITFRDASELVKIQARGSSELNQSHIELVSLISDAAHLLSLAGPNEILTNQEHSGTNVTSITTARYVDIWLGNGRRDPTNLEELVRAEQLLNSTMQTSEMMEMAAAIYLLVTHPLVPMPVSHATTLDLMKDQNAIWAVIAQLKTATGADLIAQSLEEILQNPNLVGDFQPGRMPSSAYLMLKTRHGYIGRGGERFDFSQDPRGRNIGAHQPSIQAPLPDLAGFLWSVDDLGVLSIVFDDPAPNVLEYLDTEQVAAFYPDDPQLQQQIREALSEVGGLEVGCDLVRQEHRLLAEGVAVDCVQPTNFCHWNLSSALNAVGVEADDVEERRFPEPFAWFREEHISWLSFTPELLVATVWAMQIVAPADRADYKDDFQAGEPVLSYAMVAFHSDGTARAEDGVNPAGVNLDWQILQDDGRLELTYPGGEQQIVGIWDVQGSEYGLIVWYYPTTGGIYTGYWRAARANPAFSMTSEFLVNQPNQYWQTTINMVFAEIDSDGNLDPDTVFGFDFDTGDQMTRVDGKYQDPDNLTGPYLALEETWNYVLQNEQVQHELRYDSTRSERCEYLDPSCFALQIRRWKPVAQVGELVYVLESDLWIKDWEDWYRGHFTWDAIQGWLDPSGDQMNADRVYYFVPRLNAYYISDIPVFN